MFVIKPITLLSFSTESEYLIFYFQLDMSAIRKKTFNAHAFFSGGQKSRVAFADLALSNPDVIVLVSIFDQKNFAYSIT